ncbi:MAG: PAS domain S-box protein [Methanocella sp.]
MASDREELSDSQCLSLAQAFSGIYSGSTEIAALLKAITDTLPLGFYVVDARSAKIVYFNDRFCEIWGLGHLKDKMRDGTLDNRDISPEIVRKIDGTHTILSPVLLADSGSAGTTAQELSLLDGRVIRRFSSPISYGNGSSIGNLFAFEDITEQARAQENIRKSNERYKELADALPQIVFEMDLQGNLTYVNPSAFKIMGVTEEDFDRGINVIDYVAPEDRARALDNMAESLLGGQTGNEYTLVRNDGSRLPVILNSKPIYRDHRAVGFRGIIVDITEQKKTEEQIRASLQEKEVLLKEIHHRVRNNLQVISSLLSLQMAYADDFVAVGLLRESQSRIKTIALVHEKLYGSNDLARVDFKDYLVKLGAHLMYANGIAPGKTRIVVEGDSITLEPDVVVPCGLIVSELITNGLKRASADDRTGDILIGLHDGDRIAITFSAGVAVLPESIDGKEPDDMSRQLVTMLAEQLDGTISREPESTAVTLEFPVKKRHD